MNITHKHFFQFSLLILILINVAVFCQADMKKSLTDTKTNSRSTQEQEETSIKQNSKIEKGRSKRIIIELPGKKKGNNKKKTLSVNKIKEEHFFEEKNKKLKDYYINEMERFRYEHLWDYDYKKILQKNEPIETEARRFQVIFTIALPFCLAYSYLAIWIYTAFENRILQNYVENQQILGNDIALPHWIFMGGSSIIMATLLAQNDIEHYRQTKELKEITFAWPVFSYKF